MAGSSSKFPHKMLSSIQFLLEYWTEDLSFFLDVGQSSWTTPLVAPWQLALSKRAPREIKRGGKEEGREYFEPKFKRGILLLLLYFLQWKLFTRSSPHSRGKDYRKSLIAGRQRSHWKPF